LSEARATLDELRRLAERAYVSPLSLALVHLGSGDVEEALSALERAADERACWLVWLGVDPIFDELRAEPRFHALLDLMGLRQLLSPQGGRATVQAGRK
jgi:serine/threonine-protein kinase